MATLGSLKSKLLKGKVQPTDAVSKATFTTFKKVTLDTTLEKLDRILDREHFAFVVHQQRLCKLPSFDIIIHHKVRFLYLSLCHGF